MPTYDKKENAQRGERKKRIKPDDTYSIWDEPTRQFDSQYGMVSYLTWCTKERTRLAERGKFVEIITAEDGEIALAETEKDQE